MFVSLLLFSTLALSAAEDAVHTIFQCDAVFDASRAKGEFSFPILPRTPSDGVDTNTVPKNLQCLYTFIAGQGQRVKLTFDQFQLAGTSDNCELEYVDIYSQLESVDADLMSSPLAGRYCGSVSPHITISLHSVLVLVFHSRAGDSSRLLRFRGTYQFINAAQFIPGEPLGRGQKCGFLIEPSKRKRGTILSPTYPGTYPKNFFCSYLLKGRPGQRIRIYLRDFDIYFGGEHCPYDSVTIYDGATRDAPIIRKVCGLQQRLELYSMGTDMLIEFNSTNPSRADPRGFIIDFEFSSRFVDIAQLLDGQKGVTHMRGSECDVRVESNRETTHYIQSPKYPKLYPANTTCSYILDGLQGDQNLEKVILTFESFAVISDTSDSPAPVQSNQADFDDVACPHAWVGVATSEANMKATLSNSDESNFDSTLCERIQPGHQHMGPYESNGPRMVLQFGTSDSTPTDGMTPHGFRARVDFRTDFGIPGSSVGDSNECDFRFTNPAGFFNSPRYPANYPLDTNCTYHIEARPGQQILIHFEQFALYGENGECRDWLEIYDVFRDEHRNERLQLQARYCDGAFPGPTFSAHGAHEMRVLFSSDSTGTGNGFKALYEMRKAPEDDIPITSTSGDGGKMCGRRIRASENERSGTVISPGYPIKYNKDVHCVWEIRARQGYQILLNLVEMEIEGAIVNGAASCQKAVIRVSEGSLLEFCGTDQSGIKPILSKNESIRITFLTSPDKVNGLKGFNFTWTEVRTVNEMSECSSESEYMCTYSKLCISSQLRCNGDENCGIDDDTDEIHCGRKENSADKTLIFAVVFCGAIFLFICAFFTFLFKKKLERKKKKQNRSSRNTRHRQRQPYRSHKPMGKTSILSDAHVLPSPATSRFVHHDATGILPPITLHGTPPREEDHNFYG